MRILFQDTEDLTVVSALLQDALVRVGDIVRTAHTRRFAFVANRFCWDAVKRPLGVLPPMGPFKRVDAGVHFDGVIDVKVQGVTLGETERVLELLTIEFTPGEPPGGVITLAFAGGATLAVQVECIEGGLADVGEPRQTAYMPRHGR